MLLSPLQQGLRGDGPWPELELGVHVEQHLQLEAQQGQAQAQQLEQEAIVLGVGREVEARGLSGATHPARQAAGHGTHRPGHVHGPAQALPEQRAQGTWRRPWAEGAASAGVLRPGVVLESCAVVFLKRERHTCMSGIRY